MRRIANGLITIGGCALLWSLIAMFVAGLMSFAEASSAPPVFLAGAMGMILSILLLIVGFCIDSELDARDFEARRAAPVAKLPLEPREKPLGYNDDVNWWFGNGPERREKDDDFRHGFNARAVVPPPKRQM